jgi:large subunit ribosomal protein L9
LHNQGVVPFARLSSSKKGLESMRVLLLKDVYKLGHAGDVKKVADGYARNFLIPRGMAVLATAGAVRQAETLRSAAGKLREKLNSELAGVAEKINQARLYFPAKAGETGKLYGSITTAHITDALNKEIGENLDKRIVVHQPIRELGQYKVPVRLTADLIAHLQVLVHREGQSVHDAVAEAAAEAAAAQARPVETAPDEVTPAEGSPVETSPA